MPKHVDERSVGEILDEIDELSERLESLREALRYKFEEMEDKLEELMLEESKRWKTNSKS